MPYFIYFIDVRVETRHVLSIKRVEISGTCCGGGICSRDAGKTVIILQCACKVGSGLWKIQAWNLICPPDDVDLYYNQMEIYRDLSSEFCA